MLPRASDAAAPQEMPAATAPMDVSIDIDDAHVPPADATDKEAEIAAARALSVMNDVDPSPYCTIKVAVYEDTPAATKIRQQMPMTKEYDIQRTPALWRPRRVTRTRPATPSATS